MDARTIAVYIGAMVVLMIMSAYFSATETAFTSLNRIKIKNLAEDGDKHAKRVLELVEHFDKVLSTILIGNNIVNIANTAVATVFFVALYGSYGPTVATVVMTVTVLIFGEISPKNLAKENAESFAMMSASVFLFRRRFTDVVLSLLNFAIAFRLLSGVFGIGFIVGHRCDLRVHVQNILVACGDFFGSHDRFRSPIDDSIRLFCRLCRSDGSFILLNRL